MDDLLTSAVRMQHGSWQPRAARGPAGRPHAPRERLRLHPTQGRAATPSCIERVLRGGLVHHTGVSDVEVHMPRLTALLLAVVGVDRDGFHLVEQYRYPVGHRSWEFPQGTLPNRADGEPAELARRELAEETGLRAHRLYHLGDLHPAKGMSSQGFAVFVADGLESGDHAREHEEQDMRQRWVSRSDFEDMIRSGLVTDDSTLAAYLLFLLHRPATQGPDDR